MNTKYLGLFVASAIALAVAVPAYADGACTNQYGATVTCPENHLVVNKTVRYPTNAGLFVDNLTSKDPAYSPGDNVEYDIAVTNTSNVNYATVTVVDQFPAQVTFVGGPGRYDEKANKLTFELSNLGAGQTVHTRIEVKVKDISVFPKDQALTCEIVNTAEGRGPDSLTSTDTSSLCVQTKVLGTTTLPVTGFNDWMVALPFVGSGIAGMGLIFKKNRRKLS